MAKRPRITAIPSLQKLTGQHLSLPVLRWRSLSTAACLVGLVAFSFHYYQMWERSKHLENLESRVESLNNNNEQVRFKAKQLTERLSALDLVAHKLRVLSDLDMDGLGGVGGPVGDQLEVGFDERSLLEQFNALEKKSISLREELRKFQEYYKDRSILLSSTPSILPVIGYPSDRFGMRRDPFTGNRSFHPGLDLSAPVGAKVVATADGVVRFAGRQPNYGRLVQLDHRFGLETRYGHLKKVAVRQGESMQKGDVLGYVGATGRATGPHVHYEVRLNGRSLNPLRFLHEQK